MQKRDLFEIGPSWFLIAHGTFYSALALAEQTPFLFLLAAHQTKPAQGLAIMWSVLGILLALFVLYLLSGTWMLNSALPPGARTYGNFGFVAFVVLDLFLLAVAIWTLVAVAQVVPNA